MRIEIETEVVTCFACNETGPEEHFTWCSNCQSHACDEHICPCPIPVIIEGREFMLNPEDAAWNSGVL